MKIMVRAFALACMVAALSCGSTPTQRPPLTSNHTLDSLEKLAAFPNAEKVVVLAAMQEFMASHREWEGYAYFGKLAREQPSQAAFFGSLQAAMQARVAEDVPLLKRVAWVEDAIAKLDAGAAADPLLGRFGRGVVFAALPERFGKWQQAVDDLNACLAHRDAFPLELDRGIYRALADAYGKLGDTAHARDALAHAGVESSTEPQILSNVSVDANSGFRFSEKRFVKEADGVYVAEGYDFANLSFIVTPAFVVAIDAGTTARTAADAVAELRKITKAPIKYVVLTHGHWDHVGGLASVREPGSIVIAQSGFEAELARSRANRPAFHYFFGSEPVPLEVHPDRLVSTRETLKDGDVDLDLIPAHGGETEDALFIHDKKHDILFVGDAFMPYLGAPFVAEGSADGFLDGIREALATKAHRLVHGHPPLTQWFTPEALAGLGAALTALRAHVVEAADRAEPLADILHDEFLPDSLREAPKAAFPYMIVRDTFIQRAYLKDAGYWRSNGDGIDAFTRGEWASALDLLGGESGASFVRTVDDLSRRGDTTLALRVVEMGLVRHPDDRELQARRRRVLDDLRVRYSAGNPFRFIVYSELEGAGLAPVKP
jgi:glyoxylase-like metal-dependent hydrolase (beta-lactamase superfamily II)